MERIKKILNKIPSPLKNKYMITLLFFGLWITLIDDYNLIEQYQLQKNIQNLQYQKAYYISEIKKDSINLNQLQKNKKEQEKFAREKFLMKKDNKDVFIIRTKKNE